MERAFAWVGRNRRMSKDYELLAETTGALTHICKSACSQEAGEKGGVSVSQTLSSA